MGVFGCAEGEAECDEGARVGGGDVRFFLGWFWSLLRVWGVLLCMEVVGGGRTRASFSFGASFFVRRSLMEWSESWALVLLLTIARWE